MAQSKLHVAAANALAKSRRAADASSVKTVVLGAPSVDDGTPVGERPGDARPPRPHIPGLSEEEYERTRVFGKAADISPAPPGPLAALISKLFDGKKKGGAEADKVVREKVLPAVEKAAVVISKAPDPTVFVLAVVLAGMGAYVFKPEVLGWLRWVGLAGGFVGVWGIIMPVVALWGRTDMFAMMREGSNPFYHPQEGVMDGMEEDLAEREAKVLEGLKNLKEGRRKFEDLKEALAKDDAYDMPGALIVPSKKAMALIKDGALGDCSYRASDEEAIEAKRKRDAKLRGQAEWKIRNEEAETVVEETKENIKRLVNHASSAYPERTKQLKSKAGGGGGQSMGPDRLRAKAGGALSSLPGRRKVGQANSTRSSPPASPGSSAASAPVKGNRSFRLRRSSSKSGHSFRSEHDVVNSAANGEGAPPQPSYSSPVKSGRKGMFSRRRKGSTASSRGPPSVDMGQ